MALLRKRSKTDDSTSESTDNSQTKKQLIESRLNAKQAETIDNRLLSQAPESMQHIMQFIDEHNQVAARTDTLTAKMMNNENTKRFSQLDEAEMLNRFLGRR